MPKQTVCKLVYTHIFTPTHTETHIKLNTQLFAKMGSFRFSVQRLDYSLPDIIFAPKKAC